MKIEGFVLAMKKLHGLEEYYLLIYHSLLVLLIPLATENLKN